MRTGFRWARRAQVKIGLTVDALLVRLRVRNIDRVRDTVDTTMQDLGMAHQLDQCLGITGTAVPSPPAEGEGGSGFRFSERHPQMPDKSLNGRWRQCRRG